MACSHAFCLQALVERCKRRGVTECLKICPGEAISARCQMQHIHIAANGHAAQLHRQDGAARCFIRHRHVHEAVKAAGPEQRGIK